MQQRNRKYKEKPKRNFEPKNTITKQNKKVSTTEWGIEERISDRKTEKYKVLSLNNRENRFKKIQWTESQGPVPMWWDKGNEDKENILKAALKPEKKNTLLTGGKTRNQWN